jgi:microcystin degradation protein MlrC
MRIAIGQLCQESNTNNPRPTTRADFEAFGIYRGDELVERMAQTNEPGGFIQALRQWPERPEIVGLMRFWAWPSGPLTAEAFDCLLDEMTEALKHAGAVDGVLLSLHGALVAVNEPDVSGRFLEALRRIIGTTIPLVATLDLHANITPRMVEAADALVLYHTAPHIDVLPTGRRAAAVLRRFLIDGARPMTAYQKIPMVVPAERANTQDPASVSFAYREKLQAWEADPRVLCAGLASVQPWLDIPGLGNAVLVTTAGDEALAKSMCAELSAEVWLRRREYLPELVDVADAVRLAHAERDGLVVLGDAPDATTSGSTGDGTAVLAELVRYDWPRPALVTLVSPEAVAEAQQRGIGAEWTARLGGTRAPRIARSMTLPVQVANLFDARFIMTGHLAENLPIDMGPAAVLRHKNVSIVVTSRSGPHFSPQLFQAAGLDPFAASVLSARSPCGFRAAYAPRARRIIMVRAPGCAPSDFWNYRYERIDRPLWPWDEIEVWLPRPELADWFQANIVETARTASIRRSNW